MTILYAQLIPRVVETAPRTAVRTFWLESMDRALKVPFDNNPVSRTRGSLGLGDAPVETIGESSPGVAGGYGAEVRTGVRPVLLPLAIEGTPSVVEEAVRRITEIVRPGDLLTPEGSFRLVCSSPAGVRELVLQYQSGLEGEERVTNLSRIPLSAVAFDPFARDRDPRVIEFTLGQTSRTMVSDNPATAGERGLGSSVVLGQNMPLNITSKVPVSPRIDIQGPFDPLLVTASTGMVLSIPDGIPAGSTFTIITERLHRSYRLNGQPAAGMLERPVSKPGRPFLPGMNFLNVAASGATEESKITLSWRGGYRSLY